WQTTEPSWLIVRIDEPVAHVPVTRLWTVVALTPRVNGDAAVPAPARVKVLSVAPVTSLPITPSTSVPTLSVWQTTVPSWLIVRIDEPAAHVPVTRLWTVAALTPRVNGDAAVPAPARVKVLSVAPVTSL